MGGRHESYIVGPGPSASTGPAPGEPSRSFVDGKTSRAGILHTALRPAVVVATGEWDRGEGAPRIRVMVIPTCVPPSKVPVPDEHWGQKPSGVPPACSV